MTRRIVRTVTQLGVAVLLILALVAFLDRNYRVLPTALHNRLPSHHWGHSGLLVTDITLVECSVLKPFSACKPPDDTWQLVNRELFLGRAYTSKAYLYVIRKREEELTPEDAVVTDVFVGKNAPPPPPPLSDGHGASQSQSHENENEKWESRPAGLWIRRVKSNKTNNNIVSDVDVLFGDDAAEARLGWSLVRGGSLRLGTSRRLHSVHVSIKRGAPPAVKRPKLRIPDTGRFRIMQLSDLHLSTGVGDCREPFPQGYKGGACEADPRTLDFVARVLDEEKPDLVVLSGDQVNGDTAPDAPSALFKIASLLIERKIPWAAIFGNHDDEKTMSREAQMAVMETLPYSLSRAGPPHIDGVGNYYIEVLARGRNEHSALTVYLLDTHAYSPDSNKYPGYAWVLPSQIEWFKQTSAALKPNHDGYTHRHMNVAFIHIPLTEYMDSDLPRLGAWREGVTGPVLNTGFRDALVEEGVVMVSAGHDHANEYCALSSIGDPRKEFLPGWDKVLPTAEEKTAQANAIRTPALWMCYAGGAGFGGYGGYDNYVRRVRVFEVDTEEARVTTWKRVEAGDVAGRVDEQIIVEGGKAFLQA